MKAIITSAICSSLLLMTGCTTQADTSINAPFVTQKTALASGIEKANLDNTVRPQDNFYQYVNGNWLKSHDIPGDKTAIGSFYELRDKADNDVKAIIEELAATPNLKDGTDDPKVADIFRSYMVLYIIHI